MVHVIWSAGAAGKPKIWKDGQLVHRSQGQNKFLDGTGNYMKFGSYKWDWGKNKPPSTNQRIIYFNELRIADEQGSYNKIIPPGLLFKPEPSMLEFIATFIVNWAILVCVLKFIRRLEPKPRPLIPRELDLNCLTHASPVLFL